MKVFPFCYNCSSDPKPSKARCSVCLYTTYCSEKCQREHWYSVHKKECKRLSVFDIKSRTIDDDQMKISYFEDQLMLLEKLLDLMSRRVNFEYSCECKSPGDAMLCCIKEQNYYICYLRCLKYKTCKFVKVKPLIYIGEIDKTLYWCSLSNNRNVVTFLNNGCKSFNNIIPGYTMVTSDITGQPEPMLVRKKDDKYFMINYKTDEWKPFFMIDKNGKKVKNIIDELGIRGVE